MKMQVEIPTVSIVTAFRINFTLTSISCKEHFISYQCTVELRYFSYDIISCALVITVSTNLFYGISMLLYLEGLFSDAAKQPFRTLYFQNVSAICRWS